MEVELLVSWDGGSGDSGGGLSLPQFAGCHVYQELEMSEEVDSNDVKLNICKEESPGVAVAAENDGQPPLTPAGDSLTVS